MHARNVKLPRNKIFVKCCMSLNDATQDGRKWKLWDIRGPEHFPENWKTKHHNSYPNELSKNWSFVPGIISDADEDDWDIKVLVMKRQRTCSFSHKIMFSKWLQGVLVRQRDGGQFKMLGVKLLSKSTSNAYRTPKAITKVVNERQSILLQPLWKVLR